MKVLAVVVSLDPALGGTQAAFTQMTRATQLAGAQNTVVAAATVDARARATAYARPLEAEGVRIEQFPAVGWVPGADKLGVSLKAVWWLARRAGDYDVIHVHGVWGVTLLATLFIARVRRVPLVVTPHESLTAIDIETSRDRLRRSVKLAFKFLYVRWAAAFVVNSQLEAETSLPGVPSERVHVAYHPIVEPDAPAPALVQRGTATELNVGFLGRLHPKKNLDLVIEAIAGLPDHVRLIVAGSGELLEQMQELAQRHQLGSRVEWLGFVSPDERARFLERIDILAMPSTFESFGMSAAEAMREGVPVIVSERTGIAEIIRRYEAGVIIEPDVDSIRAAIDALDADRATLAGVGAAGQRAVHRELGVARVGERLCQVYERAVG